MTNDEGRPALSVVIAASDSPAAVLEALRALEEGQNPGRIEVIVVEAFGLPSASGATIGGVSPVATARHLVAPPGSGVPRLRRLGLEAARGRVVAFTEDSCLARPGWAEAWLAAFEDPALVAGSGSVEHAPRASPLDRAVVYCEYGPFLPGLRDAPPARLAGNNFAVTREAALRGSADEVHEVPLLATIRRRGGLVRTVGGAGVRHVRRFGPGAAVGDRLRFGLEFGRLRTVDAPKVIRWAGLVVGPAIYASQVARLTCAILGNPRHLGRFVGALPITLALLAAWSLGEWLGWCLGPPRTPLPPPVARRRRGTAARTPGSPRGLAGSPPGGCTPGPPPA